MASWFPFAQSRVLRWQRPRAGGSVRWTMRHFFSGCKQSWCVAGAVTAAGTAPRTNVETQGIGALRTPSPPASVFPYSDFVADSGTLDSGNREEARHHLSCPAGKPRLEKASVYHQGHPVPMAGSCAELKILSCRDKPPATRGTDMVTDVSHPFSGLITVKVRTM